LIRIAYRNLGPTEASRRFLCDSSDGNKTKMLRPSLRIKFYNDIVIRVVSLPQTKMFRPRS